MKKLFLGLIFLTAVFLFPSLTQAATLSLSPSSGSYTVGQIFTVNILLNTQGQAVDGVDIRYLNYNPAYLEVQDENGSVAGVQITPGTLFPNTTINSVDAVNGRISFSQTAVGGSTFTNSTSQTFATLRFKVLQAGTYGATFDFTTGSTSDTNVAAGGIDVLSSVTNGSYTLQAAGDTTPPSVPANLSATAILSTQINLSWTASTDNVGVTGYKVYRCQGVGCTPSVQIAAPAANSYSDIGLSPSTSYTYTVAAYDAAGNVSSQSSPKSATTPAPADTTAPGQITNLVISNTTSNSVTLAWTAPGDDGNVGTASFYDIRYYTTNITDFIWNSAMLVTGEPAPQLAGTNQSYVVSGLSAGVTYYFAIKAVDEASNVSSLSNVPSATTVTLNLSATLSANPSSGQAPLNDVDLTATVSGTETGTINYTFYCNRSDTGTNVTTPYDAKYDNVAETTKASVDLCDYSSDGVFTAKVIAERGSLVAENRVSVTVSAPPASTKFSLNDRVITTSSVNVRETPSSSGNLLGAQAINSYGYVIGGPTYANGYWWWQINYDNAPDGWSVENYLEVVPVATNVVFTPSLEGTSNVSGKSFTITLINSSTLQQKASFTRSANVSGQVAPISSEIANVTVGNYNILIDSSYCLKKRQNNVAIASNSTINLPALLAGDLNDDGIINSLDWSPMNSAWFTNNATSDINKDGIVNSLDFSFMNKNWMAEDQT